MAPDNHPITPEEIGRMRKGSVLHEDDWKLFCGQPRRQARRVVEGIEPGCYFATYRCSTGRCRRHDRLIHG